MRHERPIKELLISKYNYDMKKFLIVAFLLVAIPYCTFAQLSTCAYYDGYWGEWKAQYSKFSGGCYYNIFGNYSGFSIYLRNHHPSEYCLKFQITSYSPPSKDIIKYHYKNKIPFEYEGVVEYYVSDYYPTIKDALKLQGFAWVTNSTNNSYKRTAKATIKILPYKKRPQCYNIFFEDVAIGIDIGTWYFNQ